MSMRSTKEPPRQHHENKQHEATIGKAKPSHNNISVDKKSLPVEQPQSASAMNDFETNFNKYKYFSPEQPSSAHVSRPTTKQKHPQLQHQQHLPASLDNKRLMYANSQSSEYNNSNYSNYQPPQHQRDTNSPLRKLSEVNALNNSHVKNNITTINNRQQQQTPKPLPTYSQLYQRGHSSFNLNQANPQVTMNGSHYSKYDNNWTVGEVVGSSSNNNSHSSPSPAPPAPTVTLNPKPVQYPQQSYLGNYCNPSSQFYLAEINPNNVAVQGGFLSQQMYQPLALLTTSVQQPPQQHLHANKRIPTSFNFAQTRSKSMDAHMFADSPEIG